MGLGPVHDGGQFGPVLDFFEFHLFHRRAGDDETVKFAILDGIEGGIEAFQMAHGCVLVLKGHRTVTATPEGNVLVNTTGNSGLAKGGSGDVLTGLIASLLAQGATPVQAAAAGVWMHGRAGDLAAGRLTEYAMTPEDVVASFPEVFFELTK